MNNRYQCRLGTLTTGNTFSRVSIGESEILLVVGSLNKKTTENQDPDPVLVVDILTGITHLLEKDEKVCPCFISVINWEYVGVNVNPEEP